MMKFSQYKYLILSDLYRLTRKADFATLVRHILLGESYKFIFWMRTCHYVRENIWLKYSVFPLAYVMVSHYKYKFGIGIQIVTNIGPGFYIGHFGCIFVHPFCKIGKNCNLSQGVTVGSANRGKNKGYPTIGDNVYIGPGAKIIGAVTVGNFAAIGANCVVTKDIPDNAVVVGVPGRVISYQGSEGYVDNTDYEALIGEIGYSNFTQKSEPIR
jgi:serine O-acetyltransferase